MRSSALLGLIAGIVAGVALAGEPAADGDRAAFVGELGRICAESDLDRGRTARAALDSARKFLRESPYLAGYEADIVRAHGESCANPGLTQTILALVSDLDESHANYYLASVQGKCARRMPQDRALISEIYVSLEQAAQRRAENFQAYVEKEHQLALKEEEERRARREEALARAAEEERLRTEAARKAQLAAAEAARREALDKERAEAKAREEREREAAERLASLNPERGKLAPRIVGTFRCGLGEEHRVYHFGEAGEAVEMVAVGGVVLGYAGLYRVEGSRVLVRYVADNSWKIYAAKYEQRIADDFAWKRSAIASQKVLEFGASFTPKGLLRLDRARTKVLMSGETTAVTRPDCARLDASAALARSVAAQARLAMRYVDRELDAPPLSLDGAVLSIGLQIESKKRKELEWFQRAPGVLKMMATDRLLEELRAGADDKCYAPRAALEGAASGAMSMINRIGESDLARQNPQRAEELSGQQLDPAFEEFLDSAGRHRCLMAEASAVGL